MVATVNGMMDHSAKNGKRKNSWDSKVQKNCFFFEKNVEMYYLLITGRHLMLNKADFHRKSHGFSSHAFIWKNCSHVLCDTCMWYQMHF